MRIIAGKAKGLHLQGPRSAGTRPTSDLVRGALFAMLEAMPDVDWSRVLDLYAGTGALGVESLSRGADWADFVEQNAGTCALICANLARAGLAGQAHVYCLPVRRALSLLHSKYGIILADPPYGDPEAAQVVGWLAESPLLDSQTVVVVEHSRRLPLLAAYGRLALARSRRHGDTNISIFRASSGAGGDVD